MKLDELLAEYRESLELEALPELPPLRPRPAQPWRVWMAVAAALVVVSTVTVVAWRAKPPAAAPVATQMLTRTSAPPPRAAVAKVTVAEPALPRRTVLRRLPIARVTPPRPRTFVALSEAALLPRPAVMQAIRVTVPAQRLIQFGLTPANASGEVEAEVLVGDDGIARALRVISE